MRLRHPLAAANICPITTATALPSPSLRRPATTRYPAALRLRFTFEQANHTSIPTPVPLAHHSRKEPQCSTCTRGYANDDLRQPTSVRYPNVPRCLFNSCGKPEEGRYPRFARLPLLFLGEPTYLRYPFKRRSPIFLEPTNHRTMPNGFSLAPLVFSANQCVRRYPVMDRLRCSLSEKAIGGVRLPSNTALKGIGVSNDCQY